MADLESIVWVNNSHVASIGTSSLPPFSLAKIKSKLSGNGDAITVEFVASLQEIRRCCHFILTFVIAHVG